MQNLIFQVVLKFAMKFIADMLTKENVQKYGDKIFDLIEEYVADSETKVDDVIVLPIVERFRKFLDVPDFPDEVRPVDVPDPAGGI